MEAGAREVATIEETMAAAIGAGLPIESAGGNISIDDQVRFSLKQKQI